jgi:hypothetical protein
MYPDTYIDKLANGKFGPLELLISRKFSGAENSFFCEIYWAPRFGLFVYRGPFGPHDSITFEITERGPLDLKIKHIDTTVRQYGPALTENEIALFTDRWHKNEKINKSLWFRLTKWLRPDPFGPPPERPLI